MRVEPIRGAIDVADAGVPVGTPYLPGNGTEGAMFQGRWCERCEKDDLATGVYCPILTGALMGIKPEEWVYGAGGPSCTAFVGKEMVG